MFFVAIVIVWGPYGRLTILLSMFPLEIKSIYIITYVNSCGSLLAICFIILILFIISDLRVYWTYTANPRTMTLQFFESLLVLSQELSPYTGLHTFLTLTQWYSHSLLFGYLHSLTIISERFKSITQYFGDECFVNTSEFLKLWWKYLSYSWARHDDINSSLDWLSIR